MRKEGGGLARHSIEDTSWKEARIINAARKLQQRKVLKGIVLPREKHKGKRELNSFEKLEHWKPLLNRFFDLEKENVPTTVLGLTKIRPRADMNHNISPCCSDLKKDSKTIQKVVKSIEEREFEVNN